MVQGLARHTVPIMLLARLAIATTWQGKGLGAGLLKNAMQRTLQAADIAGFARSPFTLKTTMRLLKDIRARVEPGARSLLERLQIRQHRFRIRARHPKGRHGRVRRSSGA